MTLNDFLEKYPWSAREKHGSSTLDYLWKFPLRSNVADLWPFLIDTSTFNKLLGLPVMEYSERNGRLYGKTKNAGVLSEWEEVPWEWEYHKGLNNARIYSRGFAKYVRSRYLLVPGDAGTDFYVYFGWVPRSVFGRLLLKFGFPGVRRNYAAALAKIEDAIRTRSKLEARQRAYYEAAAEGKNLEIIADVESYRKRALHDGARPADLDKLVGHIMSAPAEELVRIRLRPLARQWGMETPALLTAALHAARAGLLSLSWDVTCPHCRGVRKSVESLGDIPGSERCDACDITFSTEDIGNMEVIFHVNPEIRRTEQKFYCAAEPATKPHIFIQRRVLPGNSLDLASDLGPGEYRVRAQGRQQYLSLLVGQGDSPTAVVDFESNRFATTTRPRIVFRNPSDREETLVVELRDEDNNALRPAELFGLQLFRDTFGSQSLADGIKIELGSQNVLFTDIVGSTRLYLENGDGAAFQSVRRHFQKIFEVVRTMNGAVVKTIGDAAMAVFADPLQCARAAIALQKGFTGGEDTGGVLLRISIHTGPCLAVKLNSGVDYFGNTVNYAAKLQQFAGAREIAFSPEFFSDERVRRLFSGESLVPMRTEFKPDWSENQLSVLQVKVPE